MDNFTDLSEIQIQNTIFEITDLYSWLELILLVVVGFAIILNITIKMHIIQTSASNFWVVTKTFTVTMVADTSKTYSI